MATISKFIEGDKLSPFSLPRVCYSLRGASCSSDKFLVTLSNQSYIHYNQIYKMIHYEIQMSQNNLFLHLIHLHASHHHHHHFLVLYVISLHQYLVEETNKWKFVQFYLKFLLDILNIDKSLVYYNLYNMYIDHLNHLLMHSLLLLIHQQQQLYVQ